MCTNYTISSHTDHFELQKRDSEESFLTFVEYLKLTNLPLFFTEVKQIWNKSSGNFVKRPAPDPLGGLNGWDGVQNLTLEFSE